MRPVTPTPRCPRPNKADVPKRLSANSAKKPTAVPVERAHSELAEAPENADEALDAESPAEQPATRRNNRRRRGGARRRKPGRNSEGNGTTQHEGGDN